MSDDRVPADREEPPFVHALLRGAITGFENTLRRLIRSLNRRVQMLVWAAGAVAAFVGIVIASLAESPGWEGALRGVLAGGFLALVFAAGMGWLLLWANRTPAPRHEEHADADALNMLLAPTLRELSKVRADVIRQVTKRSLTRVPLGIAGAFALWVLVQWGDDPPGLLDLIGWVVVGALAGELWAIGRLEREYHRLYKDRVLPVLAARLGDLTYRQAASGRVRTLREFRILPEFDSAQADDEITGTYHGMPLSVVEVRLQRRSGDNSQTVFDGLLIELTLPRALTGMTAVLTDEGLLGNLKGRWRSGAMQPVRLEDPRFEQRFEVYSNDQVEARALLTPAFMERFNALAAGSGFSLPGALAEGNRLVVALPKTLGTGNLFEPPPFWKPAGGQILVTLERDIRAVLRMTDTVIDLDFWAAGRKRDGASRAGRQS
jgi:hypothetical protein